MTDESKTEQALTLHDAIKLVPKLNGKSLHYSTLWRWCRRGCRARNGAVIRLEHGRVGSQITTTAAALRRFFAALAEADLQSFRERDNAKPIVKFARTVSSKAA